MARSSTSSYRLDQDTMIELTEAARRLGKGKNTIIAEAIRDYLRKLRSSEIAAQARRQSIAASAIATDDEVFWEEHVDVRGWK
jgi:predicted DNA-binding protein